MVSFVLQTNPWINWLNGIAHLSVVILILIVSIGLPLLCGLIWYAVQEERRRSWLRSKGEVLPDLVSEDSVRNFSDSCIERIDLRDFVIKGPGLYRMRVHLRMDSGISFELTGKKSAAGKVYEPGEGETGIEIVDRHFWTESPDLKSAIRVLDTPKVKKVLAKLKKVYSVHVMGDEIEIVCEAKIELLEPIYDFVTALAQELLDKR
ncbi:MAG: hypothetical protein ACFFCJ_08075 [Promethearchaeota archaeon]